MTGPKKVSQAYLERVAADNGRLIEFTRTRAYLVVSGQTFYCDLAYAPRHRADVPVDSGPFRYSWHEPKHRKPGAAVTS